MLSIADIAHELDVCLACGPPGDDAAAPRAPAPAPLLKTPSARNKLIILDQRDASPFPTPTTTGRTSCQAIGVGYARRRPLSII